MSILGFLAAGCASSGQPTQPPWLNDQPPGDMLWGIGSADTGPLQLRLVTAESRARQDLVRQIQVLVEAMVLSYPRKDGPGDDASRFQESVSRHLSHTTLQGSFRDASWVSPDGKTCWVRLAMSRADADGVISDSVKKSLDTGEYSDFKGLETDLPVSKF